MTALCVVVMYIASISPTGQVGIVALTSLFSAAAVVNAGAGSALIVFAASALVGLLLVPSKAIVLLFAVFIGWYPVVKSVIEKHFGIKTGYLIKLLAFEAALAVFVFISAFIFAPDSLRFLNYNKWLLFIGGAAVFILYDIGFSKLIAYYVYKIQPKMK